MATPPQKTPRKEKHRIPHMPNVQRGTRNTHAFNHLYTIPRKQNEEEFKPDSGHHEKGVDQILQTILLRGLRSTMEGKEIIDNSEIHVQYNQLLHQQHQIG